MATSAWINLAPDKGEPEWAALAREFKACQRRFILHVPSWEEYAPLQALSWDCIKYESDDLPPDSRGVYAFVLDAGMHAASSFPPHVFVLYVGETGDSSKATLKSRLANYRNKKAQRDRARLWALLNQWGDSLLFYYAKVKKGNSTKVCETKLLDALLPPANKKDFSAKVSKARDDAFSS